MKHSDRPIPLRDRITVSQLYSTYTHTFPKNYSFKGERHNFWEIGYVVEGIAGITSDDKVYKCKEGDLVIHPPNYFHTSWGTKEFKFFTISFACDYFDLEIQSYNIRLSEEEKIIVTALMQEAKICFPQTQGEFYYTQVDNNRLDYRSRHYQLLKNYLEILLLRLIKDNRAEKSPIQSQDAIKYNDIVLFLKANVCRNVTIEDIAGELFESPSNLKRIFHKYTNMGIMHYYNDLRIYYAEQLLTQGKTMRQIASEMNFSSQNYFSYFFKKATGKSTSEYQTAIRKQSEKNISR